ncbi:MAG: branched-chain amino acid ABC transporter permease [Bordetella sp.]|nr:branched-chain amino acid ABC transporter permease [Pseudomonadota bacterium]
MLLQLIVSGIALGSIYALLGLALVLVHKATDTINFGQGEMAMLTTFVGLSLLTHTGLPLPVVAVLCCLLGAVSGAVVYRVLIHPLIGRAHVSQLIATLGLFTALNALAGQIWGYDAYRFPSLVGSAPIEIGGARLAPQSLLIIGVSAVLMAVLYVFFEHTRVGVGMRAASANRWAAKLMGIPVMRASVAAWAIAGAIGSIAGLLIAPVTFLDVEMMVPILLKAFAGAILGGFSSLPGAVIGGIGVGVIEVLFGALLSTAFKDAFSFVLIVVVLMFRPAGLFSRVAVKKV